jgi:hypothetical protein
MSLTNPVADCRSHMEFHTFFTRSFGTSVCVLCPHLGTATALSLSAFPSSADVVVSCPHSQGIASGPSRR